MNINNPVSSLMSTELKVLEPSDPLQAAKDIFDSSNIHHLPVVDNGGLVGMVSKTDYLYFLKHTDPESQETYVNRLRLKNYKIEEVMTKDVISINPSDTIKAALEIFAENVFHALPIITKGKLVGMITTHDIIFRLLHPKSQIAGTNS